MDINGKSIAPIATLSIEPDTANITTAMVVLAIANNLTVRGQAEHGLEHVLTMVGPDCYKVRFYDRSFYVGCTTKEEAAKRIIDYCMQCGIKTLTID